MANIKKQSKLKMPFQKGESSALISLTSVNRSGFPDKFGRAFHSTDYMSRAVSVCRDNFQPGIT